MSTNYRKYSNDEITVFWAPSKCSHATTCFRELISVFNPRKRPWINMNGAKTERIIEVVDKCPTQALSWKYNKDVSGGIAASDSEMHDEITPEDIIDSQQSKDSKGAIISIMTNGPLFVEGEFKIIGPEGNEMKSMIMTSFCRCGSSHSQPFCDGSHRKVGFKD